MPSGGLITTKPTAFVVIGLPGAGKTYTSRGLSEVCNAVHIEYDAYRSELFETTLRNEEQDDIINRLSLAVISQFLPLKTNIVADGNLFLRRDRKQLRAAAKAAGYNVVEIWVQTDPNVAYQRANRKDRRKIDEKYSVAINLDTFNLIAEKFQTPERGAYIVLSGRHLFKTQLNIIKKRMIELSMLPMEPDYIDALMRPSPEATFSSKRHRLTI